MNMVHEYQKCIMIVEDEAIAAMLLSERIQEWGWKVAGIEGTGRGAISMAADLHPDVILMDIRLKDDVDGIEAARSIGSNIPIIFFSAYTDEATRQRAAELNPRAFLKKPLREEQLSAALHAILDQ